MSIKQEYISGFVLAGGKSSRMGNDKGFVPFNGKPMIEYSIRTLKKVCSSISIIANNSDYNSFGYSVYSDSVSNKGPLAGICTALEKSETTWNIIISCDNPTINPELLVYLIEQSKGFDAVVPCYQGKTYPITAVYSKSCLKSFKHQLNLDLLKVRDAIQEVNTNFVELSKKLPFFDEKILVNINTKQELEAYEN